MNNTRRATHQNTWLAEEWHKHGQLLDNTEYTRSKQVYRRKPKSDVTKSREASDRRYQRRSNICTVCFQTKAVGTGVCGCTE